jgi:hypothetical protein
MYWKRRAIKYALILAGVGSFLGYLLGLGDFKFPECASIGLFRGFIFGGMAGFLIAWLGHLYKSVIWFRPIGGALVCFIPGLMIGTLVGLWREDAKRWLNPEISSNESTQIIVSSILCGGLIGIAVGSVFGVVDQAIFNRRQRLDRLCNASEQYPRITS